MRVLQVQDSSLLDAAQHGEEGGLHAVAVERVLPRLRLVQRLLRYVQDLVEDLGCNSIQS